MLVKQVSVSSRWFVPSIAGFYWRSYKGEERRKEKGESTD